ncbi:NAD(P)-dependent oxidoreductase [Chitinophaga parva]|uniref:NAD(P)-dependent oxidoreductase n=1 Tax=Chitinophaga parva TaxID=2169414 RepID=A0A2T7BIX1_9BACT|nr:NmrA family NAD(P)-binding protein [Chitinophaga parva]PUZ26192.1 NAD(P)-dependent oxidoreductase [Chitinophaga parva]
MGKTLITGVTGGLGGTVADFLVKKVPATNLAVLARDAAKAQRFADAGIEIRVGDYNDPASLVKAFSGVDTLYFVSGNDIAARLSQHENVVNAAKAAGVKHIVYTSSVRKDSSAASPLYPVLEAHIKTEEWIKASGLTYTITQHNLYAEVIPVFAGAQVPQTKTVFIPTGNGKAAFALRQDFAEAEANILANPAPHANRVYQLGGAEALTFADVAVLAGEGITFVSPGMEEYKAALHSAGVPDVYVAMLSQFAAAIALGDFDEVNGQLEQLLGRKPGDVKAFIKAAYKQ